MNGPEIYYFTGTGNSLAVARDIANRTSGTFISIPSVMGLDTIKSNSDVIGIVFPVHFAWFGGIPLIIEKFVKKIANINEKYLFTVCTFSNGTGQTINELDKIISLHGGILQAGFAVRMPYNYVMGSKFRTIDIEKQNELNKDWKKKLEIICEYIITKKEGKFEIDVTTIKGFPGLLFRIIKNSSRLKQMYKSYLQRQAGIIKGIDVPFTQILPLMDRRFRADEKCDGCGICKKVCPVNNIGIKDNKPSWSHNCEQCFACLHWCPSQAIQFGNKTEGQRYHHLDVELSDLIGK
jgi:ferredoxin/flavodoxin